MKPVGHAIAYYENSSDGDRVVVHAAFPVDTDPAEEHDFAIVDLPAIEQAATIVHRGSMDNVMSSIQTLAGWIDAHGYRSAGYNRELYIEVGDNLDDWVTELQADHHFLAGVIPLACGLSAPRPDGVTLDGASSGRVEGSRDARGARGRAQPGVRRSRPAPAESGIAAADPERGDTPVAAAGTQHREAVASLQ